MCRTAAGGESEWASSHHLNSWADIFKFGVVVIILFELGFFLQQVILEVS